MANQEHLDLIKRDTKAWNEWRLKELFQPDLSGADLSEEDLGGTNLISANLSKAILCGTDLSNSYLNAADLSEAHLEGANLSSSTLTDVNLRDAYLNGAELYMTNLSDANLEGADLSNANLSGATLNGANLCGANLSGCTIYGISAWNVQLEGATQSDLIITREEEPTITVDNLEVAQFVYLLLNHKKLRDVFNMMTERGVLLLRRFGGGGLEVLQAIAAKLREEKYLSIIFDFERPQSRNFTETIQTLAGLSRFIIADLSGPSVPQELYATVPHFKIPFVPIIEAGRKPFAMAVDILEYPWVVRPPVTFATIEELLDQMPTKVIAPAEEKHQTRQKLFDELFNKT